MSRSDYSQKPLNELHSALLYNLAAVPSFFEKFGTDAKIPVKKEIVGCDHQLGVYIEMYDGGSVIRKSDLPEDNYVLEYDGYEPFKFCPDCGELNE